MLKYRRNLTGWCPSWAVAGHTVRTQHGVTASAGQRHGDVEIRNYLRDQAGSRSLVFDLSIAHDRFGSSSHVQQNDLLTHPQDLDGPLRVAAQRKINAYGQQYADNQNISFLPAIVSTSCRMHGEFLRLIFLQAHRETEAHFSWNVIAKLPNGRVPFQARCFPPVTEEQDRPSSLQSGGVVNIQGCGIVAAPVHAPSRAPLLLPHILSHNFPPPPCSLVRDGQTCGNAFFHRTTNAAGCISSPMEKRFPQKPFGWPWAHGSPLCACGSALGLSGSGQCGSGLAGSGDTDHVRVMQRVAGPEP